MSMAVAYGGDGDEDSDETSSLLAKKALYLINHTLNEQHHEANHDAGLDVD
jgi:hypothetical protein